MHEQVVKPWLLALCKYQRREGLGVTECESCGDSHYLSVGIGNLSTDGEFHFIFY